MDAEESGTMRARISPSKFMPYANDIVWFWFAFSLFVASLGIIGIAFYHDFNLVLLLITTVCIFLAYGNYRLGNTPANSPDGK